MNDQQQHSALGPSPGSFPVDKPSTLPSENPTSSFWLSEPNEFLLRHRTTADLPTATTVDVAIIGSGMTGTSAAQYLTEFDGGRRKGLNVVMLEAREACAGATGRNGGHCISPLFERSPEAAAFDLRSFEAIRQHIESEEIPCDWRTLTGCRSFCNSELMRDATREVEYLQKQSPEIGKLVTAVTDGDYLRKHHRIHGLPGGAAGAVMLQRGATFWPYKYVTWILERLIKAGRLNLQTNTPVIRIEPYDTVNKAQSSSARYSLTTDRGTIHARSVIVATNGYTSYLLPSFSDLIVPVRGQMACLLPPSSQTSPLKSSYGFVGVKGGNRGCEDYLYQRPYGPNGMQNASGHLLYGGGSVCEQRPAVGDSDDSVLDSASAAHLRSNLWNLIAFDENEYKAQKDRQNTELEATHEWTGIQGYSRDENPYVGRVPGYPPGLFMAAGYTGSGMANASFCAKAVAEMVLAEMRTDADTAEGCKAEDETPALGNEHHRKEATDLPSCYALSIDRINRARHLPTVAESMDG